MSVTTFFFCVCSVCGGCVVSDLSGNFFKFTEIFFLTHPSNLTFKTWREEPDLRTDRTNQQKQIFKQTNPTGTNRTEWNERSERTQRSVGGPKTVCGCTENNPMDNVMLTVDNDMLTVKRSQKLFYDMRENTWKNKTHEVWVTVESWLQGCQMIHQTGY